LLSLVSVAADFRGAREQVRQWAYATGIVDELPPAQAGETLIVVATFHRTTGPIDTEPEREIHRALADAIRFVPADAKLRVELSSLTIRSEDQAAALALARRYRAGFVVWGADTGARVSVQFANLMTASPKFTGYSSADASYIRDPPAYAMYVTSSGIRDCRCRTVGEGKRKRGRGVFH
jgi:hypothetical protein